MTPTLAILTDSVTSAGALASARFVTRAGAYSAAGGYAYGVTRSSAAAAGELVPTDILGTVEVEAGAVVADGDPVMSDATGRAVPHTGTNVKLGRAMKAASAAGKFIEVHFIPN